MANNGSSEKNQESTEPQKEQEPPRTQPKTVEITDLELEQLKKESTEYKDKYLRCIAEAENLRKRLHKERHEMTQLALQGIIVDFLNPIDHLETALSFTTNMSDEVKNWALGFKMILNQFRDVLAANDVHPFKSVGMPFDPHNHEAVEMIETKDYTPGIVIEESLRGYKIGSKTIRPARVKVAKAPSTHTPSAKETKTENQEKPESNPKN